MCEIGKPQRMLIVEPLVAPAPTPQPQTESEPEPVYVEVREPVTREIIPA